MDAAYVDAETADGFRVLSGAGAGTVRSDTTDRVDRSSKPSGASDGSIGRAPDDVGVGKTPRSKADAAPKVDPAREGDSNTLPSSEGRPDANTTPNAGGQRSSESDPGRSQPAGFDGVADAGPADAHNDRFESCSECLVAAGHLLITEIAVCPAGAEMIEIFNPTPIPIDLSAYALSDSANYVQVTLDAAPTSTSDFAARFPTGSTVGAGAYVTVAIGNASGGRASFLATYGKLPDYELRPNANEADDEPAVPNLASLGADSTIGASASLTDTNEPIVLFRVGDDGSVEDVDYVYYGASTTSNPAIDKTGLVMGGHEVIGETPPGDQRPASAPTEGRSLHRCAYAETGEKDGGNGVTGQDETSEDWSSTFALSTVRDGGRTPGGPPPAAVCPSE